MYSNEFIEFCQDHKAKAAGGVSSIDFKEDF